MTNGCGRAKAHKGLKANSKTYKVDKDKGPGYKKRGLFLAGASKAGKKKKKKKAAEEHPLARAFTGEFDSFHYTSGILFLLRFCRVPIGFIPCSGQSHFHKLSHLRVLTRAQIRSPRLHLISLQNYPRISRTNSR